MKKLYFAILLLVVANAYSLVGFGLHAGYDLFSVDEYNKEFRMKVDGDTYSYTLKRDAIEQPLGIGAQVYFDLPIIDIGFEGGFNASFAKYAWEAPNRATNLDGGDDFIVDLGDNADANGNFSEEYYFLRLDADVTAKYYILKFPPVVKTLALYVGGGCGLHFVTPLVSEELFKKELVSAASGGTMNLDVEKYVERETVFGFHFAAGIRVKPPVIPLSINLDYKYMFLPQNDYGDETNRFGLIKASVNFYI